MKKRIAIGTLCFVLLSVFLCSSLAAADVEPTPEKPEVIPYERDAEAPRDYTPVVEAGDLTLAVDKNHGAIAVTDKAGHRWVSTPDGYEEDEAANGGAKMAMASILRITYAGKGGNPKEVNVYADCIKKGSYGCQDIPNGVRFDFVFERVGITVPLCIRLTEKGLEATVPVEDIREEDENYRLTDVEVLPYFGAAKADEEGYLLLPDGSGALVEFDKVPAGCAPYEQTIFGREPSSTRRKAEASTETALLPVFGVKQNSGAFLAIITEGAAKTNLTARAAGDGCSYFRVSPRLSYRLNDLIYIEKKAQTVRMVEEGHTQLADYTVLYTFLEGERASLGGMAQVYREYLRSEMDMRPTGKPADNLFVTVVGGAEATVNRLGFPVKTVQSFTSFSEAQAILQDLQNRGTGRLSLSYQAWQKGGAQSGIQSKMLPDSHLGGSDGFAALIAACNRMEVPFYPEINPLYIYKSSRQAFGQHDGVKNIQRGPAEQYTYRLSDGGANLTMPRYLLRHSKVASITQKLTSDRQKRFPELRGVAASVMGNTLYTDFGKQAVSRDMAERQFTENLRFLRGQGDLLLAAPGGYGLPGATAVTAVPETCSRFPMETSSVPFYAMCIRGLVPLSSRYINSSADPQSLLLECAAAGMAPHFRVLASNENRVYKTCLDDVTNGLYSDWADDMEKAAAYLAPVLDTVGSSTIYSYTEIQPGVSVTVFDNGVSVLVNRTDEAVTEGKKTVAAASFTVVPAGNI